MKVILTVAAFAIALAGAPDVAADHKRTKHYDRGWDRYEAPVSRRYARNHYRTKRLHLPVFIDGSDRVRLDRLVYRHHGIDPARYKLKKVIVHNRHAYPGSRARVKVGDNISGRIALHDGRNRIHAPHGHGRWSLRVKNAQVRGVTVLLERKRPYYARYSRPHDGWGFWWSWRDGDRYHRHERDSHEHELEDKSKSRKTERERRRDDRRAWHAGVSYRYSK